MDAPGQPADEGSLDRPAPDLDGRVASVVKDAQMWPIADVLEKQRSPILEAWLESARRQPFHMDRPEHAVADDMPRLFDAIVTLLRRSSDTDRDRPEAPLEDPDVNDAATAHARARFEQGLGPVAVVTEFRILRQEVGRAIADHVCQDADPKDIVAGLTIVGDALDGAATVGLSSLSDRIEDLRESFLAATLHDVRQPITLVEGSLLLAERWIDEGEPDLGRVSEAVHDALLATAELVDMIETLSDASRVAMGALRPETEPVILDHLVSEAITALGRSGRERVRLIVEPGELIGSWDPNLIRRLVANLVGNALKYSPADQPVQIDVRPGDGESAVLEVRDRGIGLEGPEMTEIFTRFTRTDRARRSGANGLGLGLYACRGIVEAHGGTITVHSDGYDRGTVFTVTLPTMSRATLEGQAD